MLVILMGSCSTRKKGTVNIFPDNFLALMISEIDCIKIEVIVMVEMIVLIATCLESFVRNLTSLFLSSSRCGRTERFLPDSNDWKSEILLAENGVKKEGKERPGLNN